MQSEISQAEKDKYFMVSLTREILKNKKSGPTVQHRELYAISCDTPSWKRI